MTHTHTRAVHSSVPDRASERGVGMHGLHERIWRNLPHGRDNAISSDEIADILGIKKTRTNEKIRKACNELREVMGRDVYSSHGGYFIAEHREDLDPYIDDMENRISVMQDNVKTAKERREQLPSRSGKKDNGGFLFPGMADNKDQTVARSRELRM